MKVMFFVLALFLVIQNQCFAQATSGGGGGDELASQFVSLSHKLFNNFQHWDAGQLDFLKTTLDTTNIKSVPVLLDPLTQKPIPNQEKLVAWGSIGFIQLKKLKPGESSFEDLVIRKIPVAHYLVHEIYRASGKTNSQGALMDDNYNISIGKLRLEQFDVFETTNSNPSRCYFSYDSDVSPTTIRTVSGYGFIPARPGEVATYKLIESCSMELGSNSPRATCYFDLKEILTNTTIATGEGSAGAIPFVDLTLDGMPSKRMYHRAYKVALNYLQGVLKVRGCM